MPHKRQRLPLRLSRHEDTRKVLLEVTSVANIAARSPHVMLITFADGDPQYMKTYNVILVGHFMEESRTLLYLVLL